MANNSSKAKTTSKKKAEVEPEIEQTNTPETAAPVNNAVNEENEMLKKQLAELQAQMSMMAQMMGGNQMNQNLDRAKQKLVRFYNMRPGTYVLKGTATWKIEGQFNYRDFTENEANIIFNNMHNAISKGSVYIADQEFVDEHNLTEIYRHILSNEQMKELLGRDSKFVMDCYHMANDGQKQIIIDMFVDRKAKGLPVDANVLFELGRLTGRDLINIEPID